MLAYGAPVWYKLSSDTCQPKLEGIQRLAIRVIFPDMYYDERLSFLCMPQLNDFIFELCSNHFFKISNTPQHPHLEGVVRNNCKQSSRQTNTTSTIDQIERGLRNVLRAFIFLCFFITMKTFISNDSYAFNSVNRSSNGKDTKC